MVPASSASNFNSYLSFLEGSEDRSMSHFLRSLSDREEENIIDTQRVIENIILDIQGFDDVFDNLMEICILARRALAQYQEQCWNDDWAGGQVPSSSEATYRQQIEEQLTRAAREAEEDAKRLDSLQKERINFQLQGNKDIFDTRLAVSIQQILAFKESLNLRYEVEIQNYQQAAREHDLELRVRKATFDEWLAVQERESERKVMEFEQEMRRNEIEHEKVLEQLKSVEEEKKVDLQEQDLVLKHALAQLKLQLERIKTDAETRRLMAEAADTGGRKKEKCTVQ